jgi:hypothetical protein
MQLPSQARSQVQLGNEGTMFALFLQSFRLLMCACVSEI